MGIFDYISAFNYNVISKKIFRHEVESAIYNNKKIEIPKVPRITRDSIQKFKTEYPFNFYLSKSEANKAAESIKFVENEEDIIIAASKILKNKYDILNSGEIFLGDKINWHYDYKGKYKWHEVLVWRDDFLKIPAGADIKYPWELARFHQGVTLGKAWLLTSDDKYLQKFLSLFEEFNKESPFCIGVNWAASEEVSIRLLNVFFALALFISSEAIDEVIINSFQEFILLHTLFIENNLAYSKVRGHEYLSNLLALAAAGLLLRNHPYGKKQLEFAYSGFEQQIRAQVHKDGISFEQSIPYHSFILEHFYLGKIILEKAGCIFSAEFNNRLHNMFAAQNLYIREDNSIPQIGDNLCSRVVEFNNTQPAGHNYPLTIGKYLFKNSLLKAPAHGTAELIMLFGTEAIAELKNIGYDQDIYSSAAFPIGGHYILRNKDVHLFVEAGEIGKKGEGAPGHNDTFSYELSYKNKKFIVDSGTYSYYADPEIRNYLRSVKAHNTFYIDNLQLAEFEGLFKIKEDLTKPKALQWLSNNDEDILSVQHFAYTRFPDPVVCKRTFNFNKEKKTINIKDEFLGVQKHEIISNIHFDPAVKLKSLSMTEISAEYDNTELKIKITSSSKLFAVNIFEAEHSPAYGVLQKTSKLNIILKDVFPVFINTEIILK